MKSLVILFTIFILMFNFVIAEDEEETPPPPPPPVNLTVVDQVLAQYNDLKAQYPELGNEQTLKNAIDSIKVDSFKVPEADKDALNNYFNPNAYLGTTGVKGEVLDMINNVINPHSASQAVKNEVKEAYLQEAGQRVAGYLDDMKDAKDKVCDQHDTSYKSPTTAQYLEDFETLKVVYKTQLDASTEGPSVSLDFEPGKYLDTAVGHDARNLKEDYYGGADWENVRKIQDVVETTRNIFSNKSNYHEKVSRGLGVMLKNWDKAYDVWKAEQAIGNAQAVIPPVYDTNATIGHTYYTDEYGKLTAKPVDDQSFAGLQMKDNKYPVVINIGQYNNRSYGYKYQNGVHDIVKITTNGKTYKVQQTIYTSPLILDLDGDGKLEASNGQWMPHAFTGNKTVEFDIDGDNFLELVEWVGPNDGILLVYKGAGHQVTGKDFFGSSDARFFNGYEKLSLLDKNNDKQISGEELATLSVWQDKNANGEVEAGEVVLVTSLGITSISLKHDKQLVSSFVQNGINKTVWDWFPSFIKVQEK